MTKLRRYVANLVLNLSTIAGIVLVVLIFTSSSIALIMSAGFAWLGFEIFAAVLNRMKDRDDS